MTGVPEKLKKRVQFLTVASCGRKAPVRGLVLQVLDRADPEPARAGFTVTKKVGNAVVRNRTRRRLRAALGVVSQETDLSGLDLVLIGRDATRRRPFVSLTDDIRYALKKARGS
ncbi:ribonuclease P protein component [Acetobacter sp. AN02]|uniref:ribonuclease P protein component n=1 Tax=Acetobacter sp. AN02 TaxID=2894186 RepID=UPI00243464EF|nr:ribonuclease P protein component [Acetobacter sp. AN02]MDG6094169.1 ribonuclease P protein component [Acetobacter sp. AN02]